MVERGLLSQFDFLLFTLVLILALIGALAIYNASGEEAEYALFARHLLWIGVGIGACLLVMSVDYHFLTDHAYLFYGVIMALLLGLLFFGTEINGSRSWLSLGGVSFQPSEVAKLVVILAIAQYLARANEDRLRRRHYLVVVGLTALPVLLVVLQGDLGTALMYFPIPLGILLVSGLRAKALGVTVLLALFAAPVVWLFLEDYQKQRIRVTLDPGLDPQGVGYQSRQSQIAIGSGGIFGKGLGQGLQSQLGFVPEIQTDFIFAVLAEEIGLVGSLVILMLYLLILMRLVYIAEMARDRAGILMVTGIASLLVCHIGVNVGMTLGLLPPVGIPLPLLSYGGSSMLTNFVALGLALNVFQRRFVH